MNLTVMREYKMQKSESRLGRTTGIAYFCDDDAETLWSERIWKDDNGWHIKDGRALLPFCTETFNECPDVKVIHLKMPSQNRIIVLGCRAGQAVPMHVEPLFPDHAEDVFEDNRVPKELHNNGRRVR